MFNPVVKTVLAASLAAALAGCATVGPDFAQPKGIDAPGYRHTERAETQAAHLPAEWWTVFGDQTLNALEQRALHDNPNVRAAADRLLQAQAQYGLAAAVQAPTVSASAGVSNSRSSAETPQGIAFGNRAIKGNTFSVGANFSYELDLWGRVRRLIEAADAEVLSAQDQRDGVLLMLSGQVAGAYWQLRGLDTELAILRAALVTRRESLDLVEARFAAGLSNELDVSRARVERANAEAELHGVQRERNLVEHSLAVLVGASPTEPLLAMEAAPVLPQPPVIPVGLPASLLDQRPDLAASVAGLKAANAAIGVATAAFYPSVSLTGNYGHASESLRNITRGDARQFSAGPLGLSLPILDGGRNRANLAFANAYYQEALANHQARLLTALREVEDALSDVEQRQVQGDAQQVAQVAAARALEVAQARYERGVSTYLDVTDAQRSSLASDRAAAQIRTQRLLAAVAVARALGGGWKQEAQSAAVAKAPEQG